MTVQSGADASPACVLVDHDVLDPCPDPGGDPEPGQGEAAQDLVLGIAVDGDEHDARLGRRL